MVFRQGQLAIWRREYANDERPSCVEKAAISAYGLLQKLLVALMKRSKKKTTTTETVS